MGFDGVKRKRKKGMVRGFVALVLDVDLDLGFFRERLHGKPVDRNYREKKNGFSVCEWENSRIRVPSIQLD